MYPSVENRIVVPITKIIEIITSIQVCRISWMNNAYKENVFMMPNHEKKEDYYMNLRLSQLKSELQF